MLVTIAAAIAVVAFWVRVDFVSASSAVSGLIALVAFAVDRFSKRDEEMPLFSFCSTNYNVARGNFECEEGDSAFYVDFEIINHGSPIADLEVIDTGRMQARLSGANALPTGGTATLTVQPIPKKGKKFHFKFRFRTKHGVRCMKAYFDGHPPDIKLG